MASPDGDVPAKGVALSLFVETPTGVVCVDVPPDATVGDVVKELGGRVELVFAGSELSAQESLSETGVSNECLLQLGSYFAGKLREAADDEAREDVFWEIVGAEDSELRSQAVPLAAALSNLVQAAAHEHASSGPIVPLLAAVRKVSRAGKVDVEGVDALLQLSGLGHELRHAVHLTQMLLQVVRGSF
eukprot:TRINITY_DN14017_c0_g1_i1.p1 TRINITY_DN14017_c0_g1~~TRINITY_DN14017_c0_g1_i1.p1  ORF type:complete len:188 (+),score=31.36 TRINITY_DN14017_c0_g1_i1:57-620(+)